MKKIVLMMLVAMIPLLTMAQKRSKKAKKVKTEKIVESNSTYDFMVITGIEIEIKEKVRRGEEVSNAKLVKKTMNNKMLINFDFGRVKSKNISSLFENSKRFRTMSEAANAAANEGWDFVSSNVILSGKNKIHYYYMKRNK